MMLALIKKTNLSDQIKWTFTISTRLTSMEGFLWRPSSRVRMARYMAPPFQGEAAVKARYVELILTALDTVSSTVSAWATDRWRLPWRRAPTDNCMALPDQTESAAYLNSKPTGRISRYFTSSTLVMGRTLLEISSKDMTAACTVPRGSPVARMDLAQNLDYRATARGSPRSTISTPT